MANSDSKFLNVLGARGKLASKTGELSRIATERMLRARSGLGKWRAKIAARNDAVVKIRGILQITRPAIAWLSKLRSELEVKHAIVGARRRVMSGISLLSSSARSGIDLIPRLRSRLGEQRAVVKAREGMVGAIEAFSVAARSTSRRVSEARERMVGAIEAFSGAARSTSGRVLEAREKIFRAFDVFSVAARSTSRRVPEARERMFGAIEAFSRAARSTSRRVLEVRENAAEWGLVDVILERVDVWNRDLLQFGRTVADRIAEGESRLARVGQGVRESEVVSRGMSNLRSATHRLTEASRKQNLWVPVGAVIVIVVAARLVTSALANSSRELPVGSGASDRPSGVQDAAPVDSSQGSFGFPETPQPPRIVLPFELLLVAPTPDPASDFEGAQVIGVTHLSATSSMMQINAPNDSEGVYKAVLTTSEDLDFQCLSLGGYANRLYCVGPYLQEGTLIGVSLFRVDEVTGSQVLIFEAEYYFPEPVVPVIPTPFRSTTYGAGFTWPDRFDGAEVRREELSSGKLRPLSLLFGLVPFVYLMLTQREHRLKRRLVESHEFEPVH